MMGYNRHMTECDIWEGNLKDGYGRLYVNCIAVRAHRLVWLQEYGHTDLMILHSCDTPACINLDHLRAGTPADNMRDMSQRGRSHNQGKTHCPQGHEYSEENTYVQYGHRFCKTCQRAHSRKSMAKQRESARVSQTATIGGKLCI